MSASSVHTAARIRDLAANHPEAFQLARLACIAVRVDAPLLRALLPGADAGAEADLWFSLLCESASSQGIVFDPNVADLLRRDLADEFVDGKQRALDASWAITDRLHADWAPSLQLEERVTWLALKKDACHVEEIESLLRQAAKAMTGDVARGLEVARWALRALPRLPQVARETEAALLLALAASDRLGGRTVLPAENRGGEILARAAWFLSPETLKSRTSIGVWRYLDCVEFVAPAEGVETVELPRTTPLYVELSWGPQGSREVRTVAAVEGRVFMLPAATVDLRLRTLAGEEYAFDGIAAEQVRPVAPSTLPPDPRMIDQKGRLEELIAAILDQDRPIILPGALGMGKTTLALAAAHDPRVIARFGEGRRFFVNLEPAADADSLLRRLAADLGLAASSAASEVEAKIAAACAAAPTLAILDNLESPWLKERGPTEALLGRLARIESLGLVITIRGEPPYLPGPGALTLRNVEKLAQADARALFLRHAGNHFADDPSLPELLLVLDGHPLSIELLAANAAGKADLKSLAADWKHRRADILKTAAADDRMTSLRVSLELSLAMLGPSNAANRLVRLMALLPDGMADADCWTILNDGEPTEEERNAATQLERARLAGRFDSRWRPIGPVRELMLADLPPDAADRTRLIKLFLSRAALGERAGTNQWTEVKDVLVAEAGNLDAIIGVAAKESQTPDVLRSAVEGLVNLHLITGLSSVAFLPAVAARFKSNGDLLGEAISIRSLGDIALARSDYETAGQQYEAALPLYRQIGVRTGEATCIRRLGDIALARSDYETARQQYEAALPVFEQIGDRIGEANSIRSLGDIALARSDYEVARQRYEAALSVFRQIGFVGGEANSIRRLGDIALALSDHEGARHQYEAALSVFREIGDRLGEANSIRSLGDIALARSDYETARQRYEAALPLYKYVGDVTGEANCLQALGDIDEASGAIASAEGMWREAMALYAKIPDPHSIGNTHLRLARLAPTPEEAAEHRDAARQAWASISRPDLIEKYLGQSM